MTEDRTIFDFVTTQENSYQTMPIEPIDGWSWNMYSHIRRSVMYKNSQFFEGASDNKPFKNITKPILNLQYRAEGFDVKDIVLYVDEVKNYAKSLILRKFHEIWAREENLDSFIDEMVESYVDLGGVLVKSVKGVRPEVVQLQTLAFCDQTDILSGPLAIKHFYSPSELLDMAKVGWGEERNGATVDLKDLIKKGEDWKGKNESKTPGKYVEIYEVHGFLPKKWMDEDEDEGYSGQFHIIAYYPTEEGLKQGVCLYKKEEEKPIFKFLKRDPIYGRALGFGGVEELFQPQVWTNYSEIHQKNMLDAASKIIFQTANKDFYNKNKIRNMENMQVLVAEQPINQLNTTPVNIRLFENAVDRWEGHAQQMGAAFESIQGDQPPAGTPFKLQELITAEAHSLHEYRKGKIATFLDEVYRDWIIPHLSREVSKGKKFLASLDVDEVQQVTEAVVSNLKNKMTLEMVLQGQAIFPDEIEQFESSIRETLRKRGSDYFFSILKDEFKDSPIAVKTNIAGKQKDLAKVTDKLTNVLRFMLSTYDPQTQSFAVFNDPRMSRLFGEIIESSGLDPTKYMSGPAPLPAQRPPMEVSKSLEGLNPKQSVTESVRSR